ncbi:hypothetical protein [Flavobacterium sp.]|uniref:hypothetical protein n=1 Tax=Flavobacterium sp. TaxID=239 RepID=UPI0026142E37|nr:hypothetical protein [Flavobacterium sp.]MDG2432284.1 hypothetical protein [Flavobacterium sp.]
MTTNYTQYLFDYFHSSPAIIQISWLISAILLLAVVVLIGYLKYVRARLRNKGRIINTYQKKYESDLIEYLYAGEEGDELSLQQQQIITYLKKCAKNRLKKRIIIKTLLKLRNEISGETADAIQKLYYNLNFIGEAEAKLNSKKWSVIANGISELAQFDIKEVHEKIIVHINHPKKEVRREIQFYLVKLFSFDGLSFLDILQTQLSEWDQIQLLEVLQRKNSLNLPDLTNWLQSSNESVISFTLKLAKIFNQYEIKEQVIQLFNHPNIAIRIEAIELVSPLGFHEATAILKKDSINRSTEEIIAILKMGEKMFTNEDIAFVSEFINHHNYEIKQSAELIMHSIDPEDTYTIHINRKKDEQYEGLDLTKAG